MFLWVEDRRANGRGGCFVSRFFPFPTGSLWGGGGIIAWPSGWATFCSGLSAGKQIQGVPSGDWPCVTVAVAVTVTALAVTVTVAPAPPEAVTVTVSPAPAAIDFVT